MNVARCLIICGLVSFLSLLNLSTTVAGGSKDDEPFDPSELINHHISDAHDWHLFDLKDEEGHLHPVSISLPVILWDGGLQVFMSGDFHHGLDAVESNGNYYFNAHEHIYKTDAAGTLNYDEEGKITNESPLDLSITKNVAMLFIVAFMMLVIFFSVARGYKKNVGRAPKGIQSFFEPLIIFIRDDIAKNNIGEKKYEKFMPFLLTVFFFIWFGNLLGLMPGAANLTGNISVTLTLAVLTLLITVFSGRKTYWLHIVDPLGKSMPWAGKILLYLILWPVEIIGIFTKPFSLMIRLFANITAGHILILSIISLAFIFKSLAIGVVGAVFATLMNMLELFVAILQAYVFTLLSALYFGQAVEEHH